ncbi:MAG: hypothetical protein EOO77_19980 [Oxalobacteraceae bacterium]|nr:MAG: hypothetical protein EOO77_19980 [Oxalobacteraceae bacterium]
MTRAGFLIDPDVAREYVRIRLFGFFNVEDIECFEAELLLVHQQMGCGHRGGPLTVTDVTDMSIQSQEVVRRWGEFLANPAHRSRRLAFVTGSTLARMQLERASAGRGARVFTDGAEAERWLFAGEAPTAP